MTTRRFALLLGLFFVLAGIAGFLPFLTWPDTSVTAPGNMLAPAAHGHAILGTGDAMLLGLFPVNAAHNLVHVGFGLWGVLARSRGAALTYARSIALIYALLALAGLLPATQTGFGLVPLYAKDVWLHAVIALLGLYFGIATLDGERGDPPPK